MSGSLKDRIAQFNNPSATPLIPNNPYGVPGGAGSVGGRGLVGNRLPSLDPKTAGMIGGQRRISENKGLIGNRIPGSVGGVPVFPSRGNSRGARSASPAGSVDSSLASYQAGSSASPVTSRSSSPPTSPGGEYQSFLAATLPDEAGGPGSMTPSSTRADAGESISEQSIPSTPVQVPIDDNRSARYDLVPPNLKLAFPNTEHPGRLTLQSGLSTQSVAGGSITQSLGSSRASQYDPSSQGSENPQKMMQDVSGVSTPMGTPRAERRDLEGSYRGEGSVAGEGSAMGEGDMDELQAKVEGLGVDLPDRDPTPEPPKDDPAPSTPRDHDLNQATELEALKEGGLGKAVEAPPNLPDGNPIIATAASAMSQGLDRQDITQEEQNGAGVLDRPVEDEKVAPDADTTEHHDVPEPEIVQGENAAGILLTDSEAAGTGEGPMTSGITDQLKGKLAEDEKNSLGTTSDLQTEEYRDTGQNRREQLVQALNQNEDPNTDLRGVVSEEDEAREVTAEVTKDVKEGEEENDVPVKSEDGDAEGDAGKHVGEKDVEETAVNNDAEMGNDNDAETENDNASPENAEEEDAQKGDAVQEQVETSRESGDSPATEEVEENKPMQVQVEPAPIAQPLEGLDEPTPQPISTPLEEELEPALPESPPMFPSPPHDEPETLPSNVETPISAESTPIDPQFLKSFPDVPDERRPRVQVHVSSSLVHSPLKSFMANTPGTPMHVDTTQTLSPAMDSSPEGAGDTPTSGRRSSFDMDETLKSNAPSSHGGSPVPAPNLKKRFSTRRAPKSPLLDDEDPGDFEASEGWAVITK